MLESVKSCWASLWTGSAIGYRTQHGIRPDDISLAVVVQMLVLAEASGVMFTANPANGCRDQIMISAAWGLGEAIVGGLVTPDPHGIYGWGSITEQFPEPLTPLFASLGGPIIDQETRRVFSDYMGVKKWKGRMFKTINDYGYLNMNFGRWLMIRMLLGSVLMIKLLSQAAPARRPRPLHRRAAGLSGPPAGGLPVGRAVGWRSPVDPPGGLALHRAPDRGHPGGLFQRGHVHSGL